MKNKKDSHGKLGGNLEDAHMRDSIKPKDQYDGKTRSGGLFPVGTDGRKRTLNELRQNKTYGYRAPEEEKAPDAPAGNIDEGAAEVLERMVRKIDLMDAKLEYLLQRLEDMK